MNPLAGWAMFYACPRLLALLLVPGVALALLH